MWITLMHLRLYDPQAGAVIIYLRGSLDLLSDTGGGIMRGKKLKGENYA